MSKSSPNFITVLLTLATLIAFSAVVHGYSPIKGNLIFLLSAFAILYAKTSRGGIKERYFVISLCLVFLSSIPMLYWQQPRFLLVPSYFVLSILVVSVLNKNDIKAYVDLSSWFVMVMLIGAVIGVLYAFFGGEPLLEFNNEDGRLNQLFLTTFSNFKMLNLIRPSGIFDEPGALSFVICLVAALRHALGCNRRTTWILLGVGFITTSVAHLMYVVLHAIDELKGHKRAQFALVSFVGVMMVGTAVVLASEPLQELFTILFFDRFSSGNLGDDRMESFQNGINYLNSTSFFFGLDGECAVGLASCFDKGYGAYAATPLSPVVHWGIFAAIPYYLILLYLVMSFVRRFDFVMLGIFVLLLQRPYTMSVGYSLFILLTIYVLADKQRSNSSKTPTLPGKSLVA